MNLPYRRIPHNIDDCVPTPELVLSSLLLDCGLAFVTHF